MKQPKSLVIIPARGGSKGIPRKNIKPFLGKPLIHYSIELARMIVPDDHIILSTDDEEIAEVARLTGLKVDYMRPAELATDESSSQDAILDAMRWADERGLEYDNILLLQPTSPLRMLDDVKRCLAKYTANVDMVVSVTEARSNPYYNCFETEPESGCLKIAKGDGLYTRRQDCPKAWELNGAVYVINPESIKSMPMGRFSRRLPVEMDAERSVDLDTPRDWAIAEVIGSSLLDK